MKNASGYLILTLVAVACGDGDAREHADADASQDGSPAAESGQDAAGLMLDNDAGQPDPTSLVGCLGLEREACQAHFPECETLFGRARGASADLVFAGCDNGGVKSCGNLGTCAVNAEGLCLTFSTTCLPPGFQAVSCSDEVCSE